LKQPQQTVGNALEHIGTGNNFLNRTQKAQPLRETMNKLDLIKLKSFCTAKETVIRLKMSLQNGRKPFPILGTNIQNQQGTQKTQPPKNQHPNEEMGT
jgi:hypothetical protein